MSGPVSRYIRDKIARKFREWKLVVWYDPEQWFADVARSLQDDGVDVIFLENGYFSLRRELEPRVRELRGGRGGCDVLVYVPAKQLPDEDNVLLPLEKLGTAARHKPRTVALRALEDDFPEAQVKEWLDLPGLTLAKLDELASAGSDIAPLDAVFGKVTAPQVGFELLRDPDRARQIREEQLVDSLRGLLRETFGVELPDAVEEPAELRDRFAQGVLLHEFLDDLDEIPEALGHLSLPEPAGVAACRELASRLRDSRLLEDDYRRWAGEAQDRFGLREPDYDPAKLGRLDTFEFEDRLALEHVCSLASEDRWDEARDWAARRSASFWPTTDPDRALLWRAGRLAIDLWLRADGRMEACPSRATPSEWVDWYLGPEGDDESASTGAWSVDGLLRELSSLPVSVLEQPYVESIVARARSHAQRLEHQLAERFVDALADTSGDFGKLPVQMDLFHRRVRPLLEEDNGTGKVAYVLADALRYEMGRDLASQLSDSGDVEVEYAVATPPTITKIGMAALAPGAHEGITLEEHGKKVHPSIGGQRLDDIRARWALYQEAYGDRVADLPLDRCLRADQRTLEKTVEQADLVLLRSQEIDEIGESDNVAYAHSFMGQMVTTLQQAIRRLTRAGVETFVITADHGFLLREDIDDAMKLDVPSGDVVESHRRCVLGHGLATGNDHVVFEASDLGLGGNLQIAFPRGINVFRVGGGNLSYHHGGLSLQETVVPVIRYSPGQAPRRTGRSRVEIELIGDKITVLMPRAVLRYTTEDLLESADQRRFQVTAVQEDRVVGDLVQATEGFDEERREVVLGSGEETEVSLSLDRQLTGRGTLRLEVVDVELGDRVAVKEVKFDIAF